MKDLKSLIVFCILLVLIGCSDESFKKNALYFGQPQPGMIPELFAPEIFEKTQPEWVFCTEFSSDGDAFYFSECDTVKNIDRIMCMKQQQGVWQKPVVASFSGEFNDNDQRLSLDGNTIFWRSWRPLPGKSLPEKRSVIWFATKTVSGWSNAQPIQYGDHYLRAGYPGITRDGVLYFAMRDEANIGESDIFYSKFENGHCDTPINLGPSINTIYSEGDLYVSPDEDILIVSCWDRPDNAGESDLYISFRDENGTWSPLKNMGPPINTENNENCPSFSPDGKYFFYMSADVKSKPARTSTYWVDSKIVHALKK